MKRRASILGHATTIFLLLTSVLTVSACGSDNGLKSVSIPTSSDASVTMHAAQDALNRAGGYRLKLEQSNFVLPHWGGTDNGTVVVNRDGTAAQADLARTGEQGATYAISLNNGQTYFKRSTCDKTYRVPGGSGEVLQPFLFAKSGLAQAQAPLWQNGAIHANVAGIGPVVITVDSKTSLPREIRGMSNGRELRWTFEAWGVSPSGSAPAASQDQGPGGIPC